MGILGNIESTEDKAPLVSVSLICYNQIDTIDSSIDSIVNQKTNFNYEIIIGDDCSSDGTIEALLRWKNKYPEQIKLILHEVKNKGIPGKTNFISTLKAAQGKYIALLDGDDKWIDENKLQKQVDFLESNSEYIIHSGNAIYKSPNKELNGVKVYKRESCSFDVRDFLTDSQILSGSTMFKRFDSNQLPTYFYKVETGDWFIWLYLMSKTNLKTYYTDQVFLEYQIGNGGIYSGLDDSKRLQFYDRNIKLIKILLSNKDDIEIVDKKIHWLKSEIFRSLLINKKWVRAFMYLFSPILVNLGISSFMGFLHEYILKITHRGNE